MTHRGHWADLKAQDFKDLPDNTVAVLPLGAIEQHGPHLPVSVDRDLVDAVVSRSLRQIAPDQSVLFLPTLSVTKSVEHVRHAGTLTLSTETLLNVLRDLGGSVARAGVQRLVFLNAHGGNTAVLEVAARDLRISHDLIVAHCGWSAFAETAQLFEAEDYARDLHAGMSETSAMLAAREDLVDMRVAKEFSTAMEEWQAAYRFIGLTGEAARPAWVIDDLNPDGACGNAAAATKETGVKLLDSAARNFALFLAEFARFDHRRGA